MTLYLVWLYVTVASSGSVTYSPPMKTFDECMAFRKHVNQIESVKGDCISLNMMVH